MFTLEFSNKSKKFLHKCEKNLRARIVDNIEALKVEPVPHKAVSVAGREKTFRIRIGDYRVLYQIFWSEKVVLIVKIDKRTRVYD